MTRLSVTDPWPRFDGVERIAVLRGGGLGDLMFVLPAVEALAAAYPSAQVTLLGMPAYAAVLEGRPSPVHDVAVLPAVPGVRRGESDAAEVAAFVERMRDRRFDLAVQAHGGGRNANPFVLSLGARHTVGAGTPDAPPLDRTMPYRYYQHEVQRWLEVAALAGAAPVSLEPHLAVSDAERADARERLGAGTHLVVHPGATDGRRRWPADRFGAVAAAVARGDVVVTVVGDAGEADLAHEVVAAARAALPAEHRDAVRSWAGGLSIRELLGVLAAADVVLANDSGPRHLAHALGTPTVGVFMFPNVVNAAPVGRLRHRVLSGFTSTCPVCGADQTFTGWRTEHCGHEVSFVADVDTDDVLFEVLDLLGRAPTRIRPLRS